MGAKLTASLAIQSLLPNPDGQDHSPGFGLGSRRWLRAEYSVPQLLQASAQDSVVCALYRRRFDPTRRAWPLEGLRLAVDGHRPLVRELAQPSCFGVPP